MKSRNLFFLIFCLSGVIITSCNKSSEEPASDTNLIRAVTPYTAGQILTYSFVAGGDTMVKMRDEVIDYGFKDFPVLMLVHKETLIRKTGWGSIFFPLPKDRLETFMSLWAAEFHLSFTNQHEKAFAYRNFLDYIVSKKLDAGLFVDLVMGGKHLQIGTVMNIVSESGKAGNAANDCLFRKFSEVPPSGRQTDEPKSPVGIGTLALSVAGVFRAAEIWIDFVKNGQPVANAPENYASYICLEDTVLSHYTGGTSFRSKDYALSYDAGLWEAKCTYHLEGVYNAVNKNYSGKYIPSCNTLSTYVHVNGPDFIVDGSVGYSPPINVGTFDVPVAEMNGKVSVTYGDCCCFRKFSYLNYKINASTGYTETTFDPGK